MGGGGWWSLCGSVAVGWLVLCIDNAAKGNERTNVALRRQNSQSRPSPVPIRLDDRTVGRSFTERLPLESRAPSSQPRLSSCVVLDNFVTFR